MLNIPDDPGFIEWLNDNMEALHLMYASAYSVGHHDGTAQREPKCPRCGSVLGERDVDMGTWTGKGACCTQCEWPDEPKRNFKTV